MTVGDEIHNDDTDVKKYDWVAKRDKARTKEKEKERRRNEDGTKTERRNEGKNGGNGGKKNQKNKARDSDRYLRKYSIVSIVILT